MPATERWSSLFVCSLLLLTPLIIFVRHHDYALLQPEVLLAIFAVAAFGLVFGCLLLLLPSAARVAIVAAFALAFIDLQLDFITTGLRALGLYLAAGAALWPLRLRLGRTLGAACAIMVLTTLPMSPGDGGLRVVESNTAKEDNEGLTPVIHIILDEHIAIDGIPTEFDPAGTLRKQLEHAYTDLGFHVFTRAFSRHFTTPPSLSHLVNLSDGANSFEFYDSEQKAVTHNAYFDAMAKRGYQIEVLQTDYIDFCGSPGAHNITRCTTYTLESTKAIEASEMPTGAKARAILGMFGQRSYVLKEARLAYREASRELASANIHLPPWPLGAARMSTVSSMQALLNVEEDLLSLRGGSLYFAHILLPHFSYAYDKTCAMRPSPFEWLTYKAPELRPTRNNPGTRAERYPLYLEQVQCTTRLVTEMLGRVLESEPLRGATVIVHGDHGSRINLTTPNTPNMHRLGPADFADAFSTHFAIRPGAGNGALDRRSIAIDELLSDVVKYGEPRPGTDWIRSPNVYITGQRPNEAVARKMMWPTRAPE
ncbi:MAG: hypothetical protein ACI8W3_002223 [Myxococcota bacterium]|jgi:hypothetical protein